MIVRTVALRFQFGFAVNCPFAYSFGKRDRPWQKDFEILRGVRGSQSAGVFS